MFFALQNPVVTIVWCLWLVQTIMAALFFPIECAPYCQKQNTPELVLILAYLGFMTLCCTLGPGFYDANDVFKFYSLPWAFRYKLEVACFAGALVYLLLRIYVRKLVLWLERNRVHDSPHD